MDVNEMSAYGISKSIADIIEQGFSYDEETGEVYFQQDDLDSLQEALDKKIDSICGLIKSYEAKAEGFKQRDKEIKATQKRYETKAEKLKKYLDLLLEMNDKKDGMQTENYAVSYRKSSSGEIFDSDALSKYIESKPELKEKYYKVTYEIKKKELNDDFKNGEEIPGFRIVTNRSLQIR